MASFKEMQQPSRPLTHRPSSISNASSIAGTTAPNATTGPTNRQSHSRTSSHSIIGAALNPNHRVSRRKSMTSPGAPNVAAMAALIQEADGLPITGVGAGARRSTLSKNGASIPNGSPGSLPRHVSSMAAALSGAYGVVGSLPLPSPPASLPSRKFVTADGSAIDDDANDMSDGDDQSGHPADASSAAFEIARVRRASDGQPLVKEGRRSSRMELRCDKCGKGYKHSSCLTKHLWEHTPEWSYTSKLLISKHQQVQLLEAASVLVAMNNNHPTDTDPIVTTPPDSARGFGSDRDSASPAASGYSDQHDGRSSIYTTPPPSQTEAAMNMDGTKWEPSPEFPSPPQRPSDYRSFSQRLGTENSSADLGRSYQSSLGFSAFDRNRQASQDNIRPASSGKGTTGKEDGELAAAVELLSCSFNSNGGEAIVGSVNGFVQGVPPVPPVPVQYLSQTATPLGDTSFINSFPSRAPESFTRGDRLSSSLADDITMEESGESQTGEDDDDIRSRARSDDDDDGVFGRMEE